MKDYLVCIDSDGCAIDSMEIKHRRCFGPCIIPIWHLEAWETEILNRWNKMNLYSMNRGINRFLGLEKILTEIDRTYTPVEGLEQYQDWCGTTAVFSNAAVEEIIRLGGHPIFAKVLEWSQNVNQKIEEISEEILPFDGVKKALENMREFADIAIVSSANLQAVRKEWTRFGFMDSVDYVMAQDAGTKADCIRKMAANGYKRDHILVLGDAPGDEQAAKENGVLYYPILAGHEKDSWEQLSQEALPLLASGTYGMEYQKMLTERFHKNLGE
ncbi:MAG: HAD family hydrolase [Fusicatenibacter sp.]